MLVDLPAPDPAAAAKEAKDAESVAASEPQFNSGPTLAREAEAKADEKGSAAVEWGQYEDEETGAPYWYNHSTGETSWVNPNGSG